MPTRLWGSAVAFRRVHSASPRFLSLLSRSASEHTALSSSDVERLVPDLVSACQIVEKRCKLE